MAKDTNIFSGKYLGFYLELPYSDIKEGSKTKPFLMISNEYVKKGSQWKLAKSTYSRITAKEYAYRCNKETTRFFNRLGYARQHLNYTYAGYICRKWVAISPDKTEKTEDIFYVAAYDGDVKSFRHAVQEYGSKRA